MLNWRLEEKEYINKKIKAYHDNQTTLSLMFTSEKQELKNIEDIKERAMLRYRENKLDSFLYEIQKERERIDDLVKELNEKIEKELKETYMNIDKEIKPIEIKVRDIDDLCGTPMEIVTIQITPKILHFMQEKIGDNK